MQRHRKWLHIPRALMLRAAMLGCAMCMASCVSRTEFLKLQDALHDVWTMTACTVADREFFDRLRAECPPESSSGGCKTYQIMPALRRRGGLQSLFHGQKIREAFYLPRETRTLPEYRRSRLEKLVKFGPIFESTRFVVVARTDPTEPRKENEATLRSQVVINHLVEQLLRLRHEDMSRDDSTSGVLGGKQPVEKLIWRWRYDAPLRIGDLDELDRPQENLGEPQNINRGVWVFRVDC